MLPRRPRTLRPTYNSPSTHRAVQRSLSVLYPLRAHAASVLPTACCVLGVRTAPPAPRPLRPMVTPVCPSPPRPAPPRPPLALRPPMAPPRPARRVPGTQRRVRSRRCPRGCGEGSGREACGVSSDHHPGARKLSEEAAGARLGGSYNLGVIGDPWVSNEGRCVAAAITRLKVA